MDSYRWAQVGCLLICISIAGCVKEKKETAPIRLLNKIGTVSLNQRGKDAAVDMVLKIGDRIITGEKSMATLLLPDSSKIRIFEKSEFTIIRRTAIGDSGDAGTVLALDKGRTMLIVKKLSKGDRLSVETPTAVAAVRGTTFDVSVRESSTRGKSVVTDVRVLKGTVYVEAKERPLVNSTVQDGEMISLSGEAVVEDKKPIPEKTLKELRDEERELGQDSVARPDTEEVKDETPDKTGTAPPVLKTEAAIKEYYHKLEVVNLDDGTTLVGAVIYQDASIARIHTSSGVVQVPTSSIKTIRMR